MGAGQAKTFERLMYNREIIRVIVSRVRLCRGRKSKKCYYERILSVDYIKID